MKKPLTNPQIADISEGEARLKRLHFRSWHRGWKETDLILGSFADAKLHTLSASELDAYEHFLDEDDDIIWAWIIGKTEAADEFRQIVAMLEGYGSTA